MRSHLLVAILSTFLITLSFAGSASYIVTYSPDNPVVGELVTFTFENGATFCSYAVDTDAANVTVGLMSFPGSHTY